jgi:hypothetical protein
MLKRLTIPLKYLVATVLLVGLVSTVLLGPAGAKSPRIGVSDNVALNRKHRPPIQAIWTAPTNAKVGVPTKLDGTASTGVKPLACTWTFEDSAGTTVFTTREGCLIEFTFSSTGTKYVRLTVKDAIGRTASNRQSFVVSASTPPPPPPPPPPGEEPTDTTPPDTTITSGP